MDPISVLISAGSDISHLIKTISKRRRQAKTGSNGIPSPVPLPPVHFYVHEPSLDVLARILLLLGVVCDWEVPLRQRVNTFLEIFGNSHVQERTKKYIAENGKRLVDLLCNQAGALEDVVDFSLLKFKERDDLETIFKGWSGKEPFKMEESWDARMRQHYEQRYDSRNNVIDWDYNFHLTKVEECKIIHTRQYRGWRNTGLAFEFGYQTYTNPNLSLASWQRGRVSGRTEERKGYWGDIYQSPYISLGLEAERTNAFADTLFAVVNKGTGTEQQRHHTVILS